MEYARCNSSHTVALPDGSYCYCRLDCGKPFAEFLPYAQAEVARVKAAPDIGDGEDGESLFFISTLPWLRFTGLRPAPPIPTRASPLANASNRTAKPACPST